MKNQKRKIENVDDANDLPLGWTKISRRRNLEKTSNDQSYEYCCNDPTCTTSNKNPPISSLTESNESQVESIVLNGIAIFCMHSLSTKWFQGQFVPKDGRKPIALLAQQRNDVDDCLQCADNGYREVDLIIFSRYRDIDGERQKICLQKCQCTGGDMLRIVDGESKQLFEAERIVTGIKVVPIVEKYFKSIIPKTEESQSLLDLMPDVAIVVGDMTLILEKDFVDKMNSDGKKESIVSHDGWLSD